jgi:hypothetical protein
MRGVAAYELVYAPAGGGNGPLGRIVTALDVLSHRCMAMRRLRSNCRSVSTSTTIPVGRWVARTAVLALFRC